MSLSIAPGHIGEIRALVKTGDINLQERRETFERMRGLKTICTDEQLIRAIAATDDDDDDLFCDNVMLAEKEPA